MVEMHDIIDNLERRIRRELGFIVTIHMDPIAIEDEEVAGLKAEVLSLRLPFLLHIGPFRTTIFPYRSFSFLFSVKSINSR